MQVVVPEEYQYLYVHDDEHPILKVPSDALRVPSREVAKITKRHVALFDSLTRIMRQAHGVGLAAPQIGIHERIVVISPGNRPTVLVNPKVVRAEGSQVGEEGCLSIPGLYGDVERAEFVEVEAFDRKGRACTYEMEGMAARVVQHEIDHLDGVLFIDKVDPTTLHWMHPYPDDMRAE